MNQELIKQTIIDRGYIPLPIKCESWFDKVHFEDENGYKYSVGWETFKHSKNFKAITYSNPYSVENAQHYLKINNIPLELISTEIKSVSDLLEFKDLEGHIFKRSWNAMKRGDKMCLECSRKFCGQKRRLGKEKILKSIKDKGYIVLEYEGEIGVDTPIVCCDKLGYKYIVTYNRLINSLKTPDKFNPFNPFSIENIKNYLSLNDAKLYILSDEYFGYESPLKLRCECGKIFNRTLDDLLWKKNYQCIECSNIVSNYEHIISNYLDSLHIRYKREYRFETCVRNERKLPFDFYLPFFNSCIEVDGEQHFKPVRFGGITEEKAEENFERQKIRDKIKNNYCESNGIKLLRISYKDILNNSYKQKIDSFLGL